MADHIVDITPPIPGESPFVTVSTPWIAGTDDIQFKFNDDAVKPHWVIARGTWRLVCDGNAANRRMEAIGFMVFGPGADDVQRFYGYKSNADIVASTKGVLFWTDDTTYTNVYAFGYDTALTQVIRTGPRHCLMAPPDYLELTVSNGLAGDLHRAIITFEYLNPKLGITMVE